MQDVAKFQAKLQNTAGKVILGLTRRFSTDFLLEILDWKQADCNGSDNELSEQSYVQSRSMRDRPVRHFARCYSLGF